MPFTLAHPAAAVPLLRPLGRYGVLSALVIGSFMPDLPYLFAFGKMYATSHSLMGLLLFCLPTGLLSYVTFHALLKGPLLGLMPVFVFSRVGVYAANYRSLPSVSWGAVTISLLVGSITHLAWDSFTHQNTPVVNAFPMLQYHLFSVGNYPIYLFKLLQHLSTVLGITLMALWTWRQLKLAPQNTHDLPVMLSTLHRYLVVAVLVLLPAGVGFVTGIPVLNSQSEISDLQIFAGKAVFSSMPTFFLLVVTYSIGWHFRRFRG